MGFVKLPVFYWMVRTHYECCDIQDAIAADYSVVLDHCWTRVHVKMLKTSSQEARMCFEIVQVNSQMESSLEKYQITSTAMTNGANVNRIELIVAIFINPTIEVRVHRLLLWINKPWFLINRALSAAYNRFIDMIRPASE